MDLSIASNPYKGTEDAQEFAETLIKHRRFMRGEPESRSDLDVTAFENLRKDLDGSSLHIRQKPESK